MSKDTAKRPKMCLLRLHWIIGLLMFLSRAQGSVFDEKTLELDLSDTNCVAEISPSGFLCHPIAVGFFWRPTASVRIRAEVLPAPQDQKTPDGKTTYWEDTGRMYVRYSPDLLHWSTWQVLAGESRSNRVFQGDAAVPHRGRQEYQKLRVEYGNREDVPWSCDEEAVVRWVLKSDPKFFERSLPFIGYVQLLYEGWGAKALKAKLSYWVGGLSHPPGDPELEKQMWVVPWRFRAEDNRVKRASPANGSLPISSETNSTSSAAGSRR